MTDTTPQTVQTGQNPDDAAETILKPEAKSEWVEVAHIGDAWHWCLWAKNGRPLAINPVGYASAKQATQAAKNAASAFGTKPQIVVAEQAEDD